MTTSTDPTPKDVVLTLMKKTGQEETILPNSSSSTANKVCYIYSCPRGELCTTGGSFKFKKGSGFSNPFSHLRSCVAGGSKTKLIEMYYASKADPSACSGIFQPHLSCTEREKAMYAYIRLIVLQSLPISIVEQKEFRELGRFNIVFSRKTITTVILALVQIVEKRIAAELNGTKGAIMYDGWTRSGTHYLGIIAVFNRKVSVMCNGVLRQKLILSMPLLSASPIATVLEEDPNGEELFAESSHFNAVAHIRQFEDVFHLFKINVHHWAVAQIADNCSLNKC